MSCRLLMLTWAFALVAIVTGVAAAAEGAATGTTAAIPVNTITSIAAAVATIAPVVYSVLRERRRERRERQKFEADERRKQQEHDEKMLSLKQAAQGNTAELGSFKGQVTAIQEWLRAGARAGFFADVKHAGDVLFVEDNDAIQQIFASLAAKRGYSIIPAGTVERGRAQLGLGKPPDVLLLDLNVAGDPGEILIGDIRAANLPTRIIVVTGEANPERIEMVKSMLKPERGDRFVQKPVDPLDVVDLFGPLARAVSGVPSPSTQTAEVDHAH